MAKTILLALIFGAFELSAQSNSAAHAGNTNSYSAGSKEDLSRLAGQLIDDTNNARAELQNGNNQAAIDDVNHAQHTLNEIEARAPAAALVPVYQEFVSVSILTPVVAEQNARKAAQQLARKETAQKGSNPITVHQVAGEYTRVMLDMVITKKALAAAEYDLGGANWKAADNALSDVQQAVEMESVKSDMPLSRARENLILARYAARQGNYAEAKDSLNAAAKSLSAYVADNGPHAGQAKQVDAQIKAFANNLQQDKAQSVAKINHWWNTTSDWSPYAPAGSIQSQTASR